MYLSKWRALSFFSWSWRCCSMDRNSVLMSSTTQRQGYIQRQRVGDKCTCEQPDSSMKQLSSCPCIRTQRVWLPMSSPTQWSPMKKRFMSSYMESSKKQN
ncbi:hypothetical protein VPH35_065909 [Triticum aestivum]